MAARKNFSLVSQVLLALTSRSGIIVFNLFLTAVSALSLWVMIPMIYDTASHGLELENISEYLGVILIGYGVAVEERQTFMSIFKLYPEFQSPFQTTVDHLCHEYGLCYLLLGLFMEACVACIKIPDAIIDTQNIEDVIFSISALLLLGCTLLMVNQSWKLVQLKAGAADEQHT
ncbi:hypothetical protein GTA51_03910 [Desulfovibrio aerotolerans]|uniref:Uncharacterized protein n=1 Tax=Solidesulfovibrio aerotolerans TaxID=295255 RepID=A0A7C9IUA9_9BACT|nr:hypothetical protein [Solidesulfovibrio aerotolerans]MYL82283.1 hypothetical protein [Solidesulfovibrio aerotolerans]